MMTSFFRGSLKRPSAFDLGKPSKIVNPVFVGHHCRSILVFRKCLLRSYNKRCTPLKFALRCRCSFVCFEGKVFRLHPQDNACIPIPCATYIPEYTCGE